MSDPAINGLTSLALHQATAPATGNKTIALKTARNLEKIDTAARDFEAMFMTEMMKPMFEELEPDPMFGGGKGEEIFQGFLLQEYGKLMAETGGIGLAGHIKAEMIRLQEQANGQTNGQETGQ